jgi:glutamate dehydrogenase (NADP+)
MLATKGESLDGKACAVSGSGNVAQYTTEKINELGGKVVTMSDSGGMIHDPSGIDAEKLAWVMDLKNGRRGRISEYVEQFKGATYTAADASRGFNPIWDIDVDCAFPCATQNEINAKDAANLMKNNVGMVAEGANMPSIPDAVDIFIEQGILYGPGKAANAGGVAVSGLEMSQNSMRIGWTREEVDKRLHDIMINIHAACRDAAEAYGAPGNYVNGANIAGFKKIADSMLDQGLV